MKFRPHINLATVCAAGSFSLLAGTGLPRPFSDIPCSLAFILLGAGLVDLDLWKYGAGHRVTSFFHRFEAPWLIGGVLSVLYIIPFALPFRFASQWQWICGTLILVCAGWFFHILGDFIEGGVGSRLFARGKYGRIGFTWLKWDRYNGTLAGFLLDSLVFLGGAASIAWLFSFSDGTRFTLLPELLAAGAKPGSFFSLLKPEMFPLFGKLAAAGIWAVCMLFGKGGFKGFFWRLLFTLLGSSALWYLRTHYWTVMNGGFSL